MGLGDREEHLLTVFWRREEQGQKSPHCWVEKNTAATKEKSLPLGPSTHFQGPFLHE